MMVCSLLVVANIALLIANIIFFVKIQEKFDEQIENVDEYADKRLKNFKNGIEIEDWRKIRL